MELTDRQKNEIDYHRQHAMECSRILTRPMDYSVLDDPSRRRFNEYWRTFERVKSIGVTDKKVLVVGCGFGEDALRLAKLGAVVHAFDLSPEVLSIARQLAERERLDVEFQQCPAESTPYRDSMFDCIFVRDILHHVSIEETMREIARVSKPGADFILNEIYSHSATNVVRHSGVVDRFLYKRMQRFVYGGAKPYITADEKKLDERDIDIICRAVVPDEWLYFNLMVTRIVPGKSDLASKLDKYILAALGPASRYLAGRVVMFGRIRKS